jgi:hypothetical protein
MTFDKNKFERRFGNSKVGIPFANFGWAYTKHLGVEHDCIIEIAHV